MNQIVVDAELIKQLEAANGPVNLVDAAGTVIAVCTPVRQSHTPFPVEEIQRGRHEARESRELGNTLADILKRIGNTEK